MKKILVICALLVPAFVFGSEESGESGESSSDSASDSSLTARVQIAYDVKRDAEGYLAGSEMTRALRLRLEQLQSENPDLDSDMLVEYALDEADMIIAEQREDHAPE